jgi:N6-L-threonylcarbamoyladenine synthase
MNNLDVVLAVDTSNYTTSLSVMTVEGELLLNQKRLLTVKSGERGLRQSDALFAHTVNLPELFESTRDILADRRIVAVGVSDKPRDVSGSYMPCFLAGVCAATSTASALGVPLYRFSHQAGHISAALYSSGRSELASREFCAFHVSGGTTEILRVTPCDDGFLAECVGGTSDLNAGQIIDRVGVYMGLSFPAGAELERLALTNTAKLPKRKICVRGLSANLSGLENVATRLYDETGDKALVSAFVLDFVGRTLDALSTAYTEQFGKTEFVYAGGVMCNSIIKKMLSQGRTAYFAEPAMSSDNAVGTAALTLAQYLKGK